MKDIDVGQVIFNAIGTLSHIGFNIWPYAFFILLPILVFIARPSSSSRLHAVCLISAIILGYIFINASLQTSRNIVWDTYQECQSQFPDGAIQHHEECGEINIADGASYVFGISFGWIPTMIYISPWESIWRILYRKRIRNIQNNFKGKRLSNFLIGLGLIFSALLSWQLIRVFVY